MNPLYHGTIKSNLSVIKPFKRFTPGGEDLADKIPPRIYATYEPAFAVAHSFPWSSDDGVDILVEDNTITVVVPKDKRAVLEQDVCIYTLPDETFEFTTEEETGLTYHSMSEITPIGCERFDTVSAAMQHFGGQVRVV